MKLLLDSHIILWCLSNPVKLGATVRDVIANRRYPTYISAASLWELAIKEAKGLLKPPLQFDEQLAGLDMSPLPITWAHARQVRHLPPIHKDPFDRLLVAQCQLDDFTLITRDSVLEQYGITILLAG